ncbi:hypothetical protein GO986_12725 [Deinococcus sp. HMF7620]|uniref:Uncharacterized protein n=1 Tax=Deinococcus arboris TaxID=2682977 RepID=A0A7C9HS93_9DEIO|nr:hypothetical protein [Deinococcus arboris]MVN87629.1 hypothetical protein [Deinococcus arboris]
MIDPLANAVVEVTTLSNIPVISGFTYDTGGFDLLTSQQPQALRIRITGLVAGEQVTLQRIVYNNTGKFQRINLLSTLIGGYLDRHPQASEAQASRAIGQLLSLPRSLNLHRELPTQYFDPAVFVSKAKASGGINAFLSQLVNEADTNHTYNFSAGPTLQSQGLGTSAFTFIAKNFFSGVGKAAAGAALKSIVSAVTGTDSDGEQLRQLSSQLHDLNLGLSRIERDLNQMNKDLADAISQVDNDVNYTAYNSYYANGLQQDIEKVEELNDSLKSILQTARAKNPSIPALKAKIASFQKRARKELNTTDVYSATNSINRWKTQLISNGYNTSGLVQLWSHYIAQKTKLYGPVSAAQVQAQWDFMEAQWMMYVGLQLTALNGSQEVSASDRQQLLSAWARSRQQVVALLWGGSKTTEQLNAEVQLPEVEDAVINQILQQSVPKPLPPQTTINQTDNTLWWLQPGYQNGTNYTTVLNDLLGSLRSPTYDRSFPTYDDQRTVAVQAAQTHWNDQAWGMPGIDGYKHLQTSLLADHLGFTGAGFVMPDDGGQTPVIVPIDPVQLAWQTSNEAVYGTDNVIGSLLARYIFEPTGKIQTFGYVTTDPNSLGEDNTDGCPRVWSDWDSSVSTSLTGNLYRMFSGEVWYLDIWGNHPKYFHGFAFRNQDFGGCNLNDGSQFSKINLAFYLARDLGSDVYTH